MPRDFNPQTVHRNQGFFDVGGREGVPTEASISEEWFTFVNEIAREVNQEFPDRIVYDQRLRESRLRRRRGSRSTRTWGSCSRRSGATRCTRWTTPKVGSRSGRGRCCKQWCKLSPRVWMYEYEDEMLVSALTPVPITRKLARDMPLLKDWGVIGFNDEARSSGRSRAFRPITFGRSWNGMPCGCEADPG